MVHLWLDGVALEEVEDKTNSVQTDGLQESKTELDAKFLNSEIERLKSELENERRKNLDQSNRMKYLQADIVNLQRQSERKIEDAKSEIKLIWILEMISILEDLKRALKLASLNESPNLIDGLKMVISRMENTLRSESVETIKAEPGSKFDPRFHEAVSYKETTEGEGKILSVIGYGCMVGGKVIKPALVEVGRRKSAETPTVAKVEKIEHKSKESNKDSGE